MKKRLLLCLFGILVSLTLYSCKDMVFSPSGDNFVDVEIPKTVMTIDLDKAADTLFIFGTADLKYSINTHGKHFSRVEIYLDSTRVDASYDTSVFTGFNTEKYPSGAHKLRLELWARSGNGSLADRAGAEFLISTRSWNIFIDNRTLSDYFPMPDVTPVGGTLQISWTKYPYHNFYGYEVYKDQLTFEGEKPSYFKLVAQISDPSVTSWKDNNFTAGICAYKVVLKAYKTEKQSAYNIFTDMPKVTLTALDERRVKVVWNKPKCYAGFKSCTLFMRDVDDAWQPSVVNFSSLSDTSYVDDRGFGRPYSYWLKYVGNETYYSASTTGGTGTQFYDGTIQTFQYVPRLNSIYLNGNTRLDASSLKVLAQSKDVFAISSSGSLAVTNNSGEDNYPHSFTVVDPLTFQPVSRKMYTDEVLGFSSLNSTPFPSETGVCVYLGLKFVNNTFMWPYMLTTVRMNPFSLISVDSTFKPVEGISSISRLTDEGEYLLLSGNMMNLKDGKLTKLYQAQGTFTSSGKEYLQINQNTVSIYRCRDNALMRSFPVANKTREITIDPVTGYLGINNFTEFLIYDTADGKLMKTIKISGSLSYFLVNSTLYSRNGYYLKVNYN